MMHLPLLLVSAAAGALGLAAGSTCLSGIDGGRLAAGATVTGRCAGYANGSFVCGGEHNLVEWRSAEMFLGSADFSVSASLMLEAVNATAASVVLLSAGGHEDIVNLDCAGEILCSEGAHWGGAHHGSKRTPSPAAGTWFNLTLARAGGELTVSLGGVQALAMPAAFSVEGLAIRPWRSTVHTRSLRVCAATLPAPIPPPGPPPPKPKPPSLPPNTTLVFPNGMAAPGLPAGFAYTFGIPALQMTPKGSVLAFCQANLIGGPTQDLPHQPPQADADGGGGQPNRDVGVSAGDGRGSWTDIALRRSVDGGVTWGPLQIICRNSTLGAGGKRDRSLEHSCQQPAPVADAVANKIIFLSSLDNWYQRSIESLDDGFTWTPWAQATDLDATLRKPGWGLVFNGLPGGVQLVAPSPHPGRLVVCSSAYWSGGEMGPNGKIMKSGDIGSRYSFTMISDDHGASWRIGSEQVQPYHTTECSVAQSYEGEGALYMYTRIWAHKKGEPRRGIAKSLDGGETWDAAALRGLGNTAPDCEGSMISARVAVPGSGGSSGGSGSGSASAAGGGGGGAKNVTCFFVSSPHSGSRSNLTIQSSCGSDAPSKWSAGQVIDPSSSSYSSMVFTPEGKLLDLYMLSGGVGLTDVDLTEGLIPPTTPL